MNMYNRLRIQCNLSYDIIGICSHLITLFSARSPFDLPGENEFHCESETGFDNRIPAKYACPSGRSDLECGSNSKWCRVNSAAAERRRRISR